MRLRSLAVAACFVLTPTLAAAQVTFESDPVGFVPNGFVSADNPDISFWDSMGDDLEIRDFGHQSDGQAIAANFDDQSALIMRFLQPYTALSLDFGNDDPGFINAGQLATLTLFFGATQVGQVSVGVNADDIMNQTISFSGAAFDEAHFAYETDLIEVVDNINATGVVPEPMTVLLMASGLLGVGAVGLRRREQDQEEA